MSFARTSVQPRTLFIMSIVYLVLCSLVRLVGRIKKKIYDVPRCDLSGGINWINSTSLSVDPQYTTVGWLPEERRSRRTAFWRRSRAYSISTRWVISYWTELSRLDSDFSRSLIHFVIRNNLWFVTAKNKCDETTPINVRSCYNKTFLKSTFGEIIRWWN